MQPRDVRDVAIECMARLDGTVATVKESGSEAFFIRYRRACGLTMAGIGDVINAVVRAHPELKPCDEEWVSVAIRRRRRAPPPAGLQGRELVRADVDTVATHVRALRALNDGSLKEALDDVDVHLPALQAALEEWEASD